jgi:hypothetical protein
VKRVTKEIMKKFFYLSILLVFCFTANSQTTFSLTEGEPALIYSLPKTEFCIEIETEKTVQKPGVFYRYSERYLATNKVITVEKTTYRLKSINVKTRAIADANRTYSFAPNSTLQTSHLSVNSQGILCGVNVICEPEKSTNPKVELPVKDNEKPNALLPLGEEYMMAGSEAKLAEGVAKQIYRVRESRLGLLTADIDKLPADGDSFKAMMEGLNKMECELTELFSGKTTIDNQKQTINITPAAAINNQILFRLSAFKGIVAADDLSGVPYYININPTNVGILPADPKIKSEKSALFYVLPASTQLSIGDGINTLYTNEFSVPQFGKTVPLQESFFKQQHIKVRIDSQTGRLLSIE